MLLRIQFEFCFLSPIVLTKNNMLCCCEKKKNTRSHTQVIVTVFFLFQTFCRYDLANPKHLLDLHSLPFHPFGQIEIWKTIKVLFTQPWQHGCKRILGGKLLQCLANWNTSRKVPQIIVSLQKCGLLVFCGWGKIRRNIKMFPCNEICSSLWVGCVSWSKRGFGNSNTTNILKDFARMKARRIHSSNSQKETICDVWCTASNQHNAPFHNEDAFKVKVWTCVSGLQKDAFNLARMVCEVSHEKSLQFSETQQINPPDNSI